MLLNLTMQATTVPGWYEQGQERHYLVAASCKRSETSNIARGVMNVRVSKGFPKEWGKR